MNFYLLLPLVSCIACSMLAVAVLARDTTRRASRVGAVVSASGAWWAACELLWNASSDERAAHWLISISGLGWLMIGPAVLHLFLELTGHRLRNWKYLVPSLYSPPALLWILDLTTPWLHPGVVKTWWGWGFEVGPLFLPAYVMAAGCVTAAMTIAYHHLSRSGSPAERRQTTWVFAGLLIPLTVASWTDGILPILGHQLPRLGAASIALLVASVGYTFHRYGYSMLAPGAFATDILATLQEGVALLRLDGRIHSANAGMGRLLRERPLWLEGRPIADLVDPPLPSPLAAVSEEECALVTPEGDRVPVSIRTSLLRDKRENPIGIVLVARDLREIESLRSRLITSGRLAAVGQLAAGIAHEINNPVAYVRANLGSLLGLLESVSAKLPAATPPEIGVELAEGRELIEESLDGVDRVAGIVRDVKGFSHAGEGPVGIVQIEPLLESVLRVAAPQLRYGGQIVREFSDVPPVRGRAQELKQVFLNLIINASQAIDAAQEIRLVTRKEEDRVVVEVHDEGCGIPEQQIGRVFDPFFTTKPVGEGTGLGLSISYQIVKNHDGDLSVESSPDRGTCFRVELPVAE